MLWIIVPSEILIQIKPQFGNLIFAQLNTEWEPDKKNSKLHSIPASLPFHLCPVQKVFRSKGRSNPKYSESYAILSRYILSLSLVAENTNKTLERHDIGNPLRAEILPKSNSTRFPSKKIRSKSSHPMQIHAAIIWLSFHQSWFRPPKCQKNLEILKLGKFQYLIRITSQLKNYHRIFWLFPKCVLIGDRKEDGNNSKIRTNEMFGRILTFLKNNPCSSTFLKIWNLVIFIILVISNILSNTGIIGFGTNSDINNLYLLPISPSSYTFSIWGLIFFLQAAFVLYSLLPFDKTKDRFIIASAPISLLWIGESLWIFPFLFNIQVSILQF